FDVFHGGSLRTGLAGTQRRSAAVLRDAVGQFEKLVDALFDDVEAAVPELRFAQVLTKRRFDGFFGLLRTGGNQKITDSGGELFELISQPIDAQREQVSEGVGEVIERPSADVEVQF